MGLKLIPPGTHYIHFTQKGKEFGEKFGFFSSFKESEIIVKRWNNEHECFESLPESEEFAYIEAVRKYEFDSNLGAYSQVEFRKWNCLSNHISTQVVDRLEPIAKANNLNREIMNNVKEKRVRDEEDQKKEEDKQVEDNKEDIEEVIDTNTKEQKENGEFDENIIKSLEKALKIEDDKAEKAMNYMYKYKEAYGNVFFTNIPMRKSIHGYSKEQITESNFDKSIILKELETKYENDTQQNKPEFYRYFLGELQFSFILFFLGQNFEGFEQWKKMVYLL